MFVLKAIDNFIFRLSAGALSLLLLIPDDPVLKTVGGTLWAFALFGTDLHRTIRERFGKPVRGMIESTYNADEVEEFFKTHDLEFSKGRGILNQGHVEIRDPRTGDFVHIESGGFQKVKKRLA